MIKERRTPWGRRPCDQARCNQEGACNQTSCTRECQSRGNVSAALRHWTRNTGGRHAALCAACRSNHMDSFSRSMQALAAPGQLHARSSHSMVVALCSGCALPLVACVQVMRTLLSAGASVRARVLKGQRRFGGALSPCPCSLCVSHWLCACRPLLPALAPSVCVAGGAACMQALDTYTQASVQLARTHLLPALALCMRVKLAVCMQASARLVGQVLVFWAMISSANFWILPFTLVLCWLSVGVLGNAIIEPKTTARLACAHTHMDAQP